MEGKSSRRGGKGLKNKHRSTRQAPSWGPRLGKKKIDPTISGGLVGESCVKHPDSKKVKVLRVYWREVNTQRNSQLGGGRPLHREESTLVWGGMFA